jgi:hypothetical protein
LISPKEAVIRERPRRFEERIDLARALPDGGQFLFRFAQEILPTDNIFLGQRLAMRPDSMRRHE